MRLLFCLLTFGLIVLYSRAECPHGKITPDCYGCHKKDYDSNKNPNHIAAKFETNCVVCHTLKSWKPANFNHNTFTRFLLTGAHTRVDCIQCHAAGYKGRDTTCVSCHRESYDATTNPNHAEEEFPTNCQLCHTTKDWKTLSVKNDSLLLKISRAKQKRKL